VLHQFDNLPPITSRQANAVDALFSSCASISEAADLADMSLAEFVDCLSNENVRAHVAATRRLVDERARARIAEAAHAAAHALERIAEDPASPAAAASDDPRDAAFLLVERRRAASTLLRAYIRPLLPPRRSGRADTTQAAPRDLAPDDIAAINALLARLDATPATPKQRAPDRAPAAPSPHPRPATPPAPSLSRSEGPSVDDPPSDHPRTEASERELALAPLTAAPDPRPP